MCVRLDVPTGGQGTKGWPSPQVLHIRWGGALGGWFGREGRGEAATSDFVPLWPLELGLGTHNPQLGILLELVEGEKMGFHPCVYTQNTQFFQENQIMDANQIGPNINTTPVHVNYKNDSYPNG